MKKNYYQSPKEKVSVSIGIMAYNEEKNIDKLLNSLLGQILNRVSVTEIIVVSSGSTDNTNQIVQNFAKKHSMIKLTVEKERKGKASAVNLFLALAKKEIVVLIGGDLLPKKNTLENLVLPLLDPKVGIVGSHPIPLNSLKTLMGFAAHLLWNLHHQISLKKPKMGEMVAFRKIFKKIPVLSAVDEANIESLIRGQGYQAVYAPDALVNNKGPESAKEFIAQRRRIYAGHLATKYEYSYEVSTMGGLGIFFLLLKNFPLSRRSLLWTPVVIGLEAISRFLGFLDYKYKLRHHTVWQTAPSTKDLSLP